MSSDVAKIERKGRGCLFFPALLFACAAAALVFALWAYDAPWDIDNGSYIGLAEGNVSEVFRPYANRMLHPLIVRAVAAALGTTVDADSGAWWVVQVAFLGCFLLGAVAVLSRSMFVAGASARDNFRAFALSLLLLASPLWCIWGKNPYIQDVPLAAFEVAFFLLLLAGRAWFALVFLFLMILTRESSVLVAMALFACALLARRRNLAMACAVVIVAALALAAWLSRESPGNLGRMGTLAYMSTKAIAAGSSNLLGLPLWTDVHARELPWFYPDAPMWSAELPRWIGVGRVQRIGIYAFRPWNVVQTLGLWAIPLLMPALALFACRRLSAVKALLHPRLIPLGVQVAVLTGIAFLALQPFSGYSPWRYVGYSWPIAWIVVPWLIRQNSNLNGDGSGLGQASRGE